ASPPTDAAKRIVPDVAQELTNIDIARERMADALTRRVSLEQDRLSAVRSRPVLADPTTMVSTRAEHIDRLRDRTRQAFTVQLDRAAGEVTTWRTALRTLSPDATLRRGYRSEERRVGKRRRTR